MQHIISKDIDIAKELYIVEYTPITKKFRYKPASALFKNNFREALDDSTPIWLPLAFAESLKRAEFIISQIQQVMNSEGIDKEAESLLWAEEAFKNKSTNEALNKI